MKNTRGLKKKTAKMLISLVCACSIAGMYTPAFATENAAGEQTDQVTDDLFEQPEMTDDPIQAPTTEEVNSAEEAQVLNDVFGEVVYYRWDRVNRDDYPTDTDWHLSMLVWTRSDGAIDDGYIGAVAPDDIWLGPNADPVPGATHRFTNDDPIYKEYFKDKKWILEDETYYIRLTDRAEGIDVGSDPQVQPYRDTFYTDDDRDCLYVKYGGKDGDNDGIDDSDAPVYMMKLSRGPNAEDGYDYVMEPWGDEDNSAIKFHGNEYGYEWTFKSLDLDESGDDYNDDIPDGYTQEDDYRNPRVVWRVFYNKGHHKDPTLSVGEGLRFLHVRSQDKEWNTFKWFIGTKYRYSAIKGDVTIGANQMLSISASNYVDATGSEESQQGVILPGGHTVTIEKGGILSVSGDFINNGTIINNGGTILVQDGGTIYPFLQGDDSNSLGCGTIKCNSGDIIVEKGGAIYSGMNCAKNLTDGTMKSANFWLDNSSTLVNYGLVVCGQMDLGNGATVENRSQGRIYSCFYEPNWGPFMIPLSDNNANLSAGDKKNIRSLSRFTAESGFYEGGIKTLPGGTKLTVVPDIFLTKGKEDYLDNPDREWQTLYLQQNLVYFGTLEL